MVSPGRIVISGLLDNSSRDNFLSAAGEDVPRLLNFLGVLQLECECFRVRGNSKDEVSFRRIAGLSVEGTRSKRDTDETKS